VPDLSIPNLVVLILIALVIFGPSELPKIASQVGGALRDLRRIAEDASNDLREELGPEFADFNVEDLNPKRFMHNHLFDPDEGQGSQPRSRQAAANGTAVTSDERPPSDPNAA
jgi:sec-independent protein translocase protein TatB